MKKKKEPLVNMIQPGLALSDWLDPSSITSTDPARSQDLRTSEQPFPFQRKGIIMRPRGRSRAWPLTPFPTIPDRNNSFPGMKFM